MARLTYSVAEAAEALGLAKSTTYDAIRRGEIPSVRIGGRIVVPKAALAKFLETAVSWPTPGEDEAEEPE